MPYKDANRQRAYQRDWAAERRAFFIALYGGRCIRCGSTEYLEFDHRDPKQKVSHRIWTWAKVRILVELKKCQLLCFLCHREKTRIDLHGERQHGTQRMYQQGKCRCPECRAAHAAHCVAHP